MSRRNLLSLKEDDPIQVSYKTLNERIAKQLMEDQRNLVKKKEIVILGRSNVGKSSLINAVMGKKAARASSTPGCTYTLNFFELNKNMGYLVDAPGYGFFKKSQILQRKMANLLLQYLKHSSRLCKIFLLINGEHGVKKNDMQWMEKLNMLNLKIQVVVTKSDKIKDEQLFTKCLAIGQQFKQFKNTDPILISVSSKTNFGIDHLKSCILESFLTEIPRDLKTSEDKNILRLMEGKAPKLKKPLIAQGKKKRIFINSNRKGEEGEKTIDS